MVVYTLYGWGMENTTAPVPTRAQVAAFLQIERAALLTPSFEVKEVSIQHLYGGTFAIVVEGGPKQETAASRAFCHRRGQFFVGRRGGIRAAESYAPSTISKSKVAKFPLIYGWSN